MKSIEQIREAQPGIRQSIERTSFAFFDIETTGLRPDRGARITEIAILKRGGDRFVWQQSQDDISDTNLTLPLRGMLNHLKSGVVVGHNVGFDFRFIAYETDRMGFRGPDVLFIDTLGLAKKIYHNTDDYQLATLLEKFDISIESPLHTAVVDARATQALFWKLVNIGNIETLAQADMKRLNWSTF